MLFRDLRTGLAVGLTALLFSSGAGAAEIRQHMAAVDDDPGTPGDETVEAADAAFHPYRATMISAQAFGNPNAALEIDVDAASATNGIWVVFPRSVRYQFDLMVTISGAEFEDDLVEAAAYTFVAATGVEQTSPAITCGNYPTNATRLVLRSCGFGGAQADAPAIRAVQITDLDINKAGGLAAAGNSVALTVTLRDATANEDVHTSAPANIYTSVHSAEARIVTGAPLHVSPDLDPPFTKFTNGTEDNSSRGVVGRAQLIKRDTAKRVVPTTETTTTPDTGTNLTSVTASEVVSSAMVKVRHPALVTMLSATSCLERVRMPLLCRTQEPLHRQQLRKVRRISPFRWEVLSHLLLRLWQPPRARPSPLRSMAKAGFPHGELVMLRSRSRISRLTLLPFLLVLPAPWRGSTGAA